MDRRNGASDCINKASGLIDSTHTQPIRHTDKPAGIRGLVCVGGCSMTKRRQYTDDFRSSAVIMLEAQGYPNEKGALASVASHLGVPAMTLSRWFKGQQNPPPNQLVNEKRADLKELLRAEIQAVLKAAPDVRELASYRDLMTGLGIMVDKLQLLDGKPTDRQDVTIHDDLSDDERATRIATLLDRARARRDRQADQ